MKKNYKLYFGINKINPKSLFVAIFAIISLMTFTVNSLAQTNPTTVSCNVVSSTQINASWDAGSGATYYYYEIDQNPTFDGSWGPDSGYITAPITSITFSGLISGATYYVHIASVSSSWVWSGAANSDAYTTCTVIATPSTICSGTSSNLNATSAGNIIKWYDSQIGGTLLNTVNSGVNYSVSPAITTTYYAEPMAPPTYDLILANTNNYGADGVYFKLTTFSNPKTITGFTFKPNSSGVKTISVYYKTGDFSGSEANSGAWSNLGNFSSDGISGQSFLDITDMIVPSGTTYSFYLYCSSSAFLVKTGNTINSDASFTLNGGSLSYGLFGSSSVYTGYSFTGGVRYLSENGQAVGTRLPVTVNVNQTPSITTGTDAQSFCDIATVSNLQATGSNIQWYDTYTGGSALSGSTNLVNGNHYYASQTLNGCVSLSRFDVTVTINSLPTIALNSMGLIASGSTTANLYYSATTSNPDKYSIDYDAYAASMGFADETDISFSGGQIVLTVPAGAAATDYNAILSVKNSSTGCVSDPYPIVLTEIGFGFNVTQNIGTTLLLTWTTIPDASKYSIQYRLNSGGNWSGAYVSINQLKIKNLLPNTDYDCRVGIYKNGTFWGYSDIGTFKTADVSYTLVQDIGTTSQVSWNSFAPWANVYAFQYRLSGSAIWIGTNSTQNSVKLTNLLPDQDYECRVHVYKNSSMWGICQIGTFHTGTVQFNTSQDIGTTLMLGWTAFSGAVSSYGILYRQVGSVNWSGVPAYTNQVKLTNLLPEQNYECKVGVYLNQYLWGVSQVGTFTTGKVDFGSLTDNDTTLGIEWTSFAPWATSYALQYSLPAMTNWLYATTTSNTSITISPLLSNQDYYVKLSVYIGANLWGVSKETLIRRVAPPIKSYFMSKNNVDLSTGLNVYPNPFTGQINLEVLSTEESACNWAIYNMTGQMVLTGNKGFASGENTMNIDASDLSNGVYMLSAIIGNEKHNFRIVKQ